MRLNMFVGAFMLIGLCGPAMAQGPYYPSYPTYPAYGPQELPKSQQVAPPQYGAVRTVFGEAALTVEPQETCAKTPGMLQQGVCFASVVQIMRAGGLSQVAVMAIPFGQADGPVSGQVFDVALVDGKPVATLRSPLTTSVALPRNCATLSGENARFTLETRGSLRVAQEHQLAVCGGAAPPPPYKQTQGPIPAVAPTPGIKTVVSGPTWPPARTKIVSGTALPLASSLADCSPQAVLRDGLCFAQAVSKLNADPSLTEVVMLGTTNQVNAGNALSDAAQYEVKRKGDKISAHKRFFKRGLLGTEDACIATGPLTYAVANGSDGFTATPQQEVHCGPPEAEPGLALWEYYGDGVFLAMPGRCPANERLLGSGVCFSNAIEYLRTSRDTAVRVMMIEGNATPGTSLPLNRVRNLMLRASPDFQTFTTETASNSYDDGIHLPSGCQTASGGVDANKGIIIDGDQRGRFYRRYMCPAR